MGSHYDEILQKDFERKIRKGKFKATMLVIGIVFLVFSILCQITPLLVAGIVALCLSKGLYDIRGEVERHICRKPGFFFQNV